MKNKGTAPIITHAEILCLAIKGIMSEINHWRDICGDSFEYFHKATEIPRGKLEALKTLYKIETGSDYVE